MVTSRQFTRGVVRTMRAMDRAAKQAERQRIAHERAMTRQAHLDASAQAAADHDAMIDALTGAHRILFQRIDWLTLATAPPPAEPERSDMHERTMLAALEDYRPGWIARTFGREIKERQRLAVQIEIARDRDSAVFDELQGDVARQREQIAIAQRLVHREPDAVFDALDTRSSLGDLPFSVEGLTAKLVDGRLIAIVDGLDLEDMPEQSITLLQSGKASLKTITAAKRQELLRDSLCSAAVRVAAECLMAVPFDMAEVLMLTDLLNPGTGHIHSVPVLYLRATAQALEAINLERAESAALAERLGGHMSWNKRDGFKEISAAAFDIGLDG